MFYASTRDENLRVSFSRAVLEGLAPDGGLYVPENLPRPAWEAWSGLTYYALTAKIISLFFPELPDADACARRAYGGKFDCAELVPVKQVGDYFVAELYHGPSSAFKDMALCLLPQLMAAAREEEGIKEDSFLLTATSGDTGKAALCGFSDVPHTALCVFYPENGISAIQKAQMKTQEGRNVFVCSVRGNFDDAQTAVKRLLGDKTLFSGTPYRPTSANSINFGRIVGQIAYYFHSYFSLVKTGTLRLGEKVDFIVPTGNFGNIFSGYLAKKMGLPVGTLVCASNENCVLTDFFATGIYDSRRPFVKTLSPAMDILISSNLERLLYFASEGDCKFVKESMQSLSEKGFYKIPEALLRELQRLFWAEKASNAETLQTIRRVWQQQHYLADPHTAVALCVGEKYEAVGSKNPKIVLSTASPYKFADTALHAVFDLREDNPFAAIKRLNEKTGMPVPPGLAALEEKPVLHSAVCNKVELADFVRKAAGK